VFIWEERNEAIGRFLRHNGISGLSLFACGSYYSGEMNMNRSAVRWLLLAVVVMSLSAASFSQIAVGISVRVGPPALPVYAQPICPGPGYFWTPGYWAWNDDAGYYWVPGTWVVAPVGMLWTPGYWGWGGGFYAWHAGYWGPHIGFYGGINYGYGYTGVGFVGGEWRGGGFYYNRSVTNVSVTNVTNVYNKTVIVNNTTVNNVSYNGGTGGVRAEPSTQERAAEHEQHVAPLSMQTQHEHMASQNRENFASENHGRPAIAATAKPADFSSRSAVPARAAGGDYHPPAMSPKEARVASNPGNRGNSNDGFRPFTPPNANNSKNNNGSAKSNPTYQDHGNSGTNPMYEKDKTARAPQSNSSQNYAPKPVHQSSPSPQHQSAPPPQHHSSAPPPHNQGAPKEEHHKGR
jgi:hypothetical protein